MPDVIVNKNGVFIDTHVRYRTISDNLSKQEYKFLLTTTLTISGTWKEQSVQLWEKMVTLYVALEKKPSVRLAFKLATCIAKIVAAIVKKHFSL